MPRQFTQQTKQALDSLPDLTHKLSVSDTELCDALPSGGKEQSVPAPSVRTGDVLRIRPGERLPVKAVLIRIRHSPELAKMLGFSDSKPPEPGDVLEALTPNVYGLLEVRALTDGVRLSERLAGKELLRYEEPGLLLREQEGLEDRLRRIDTVVLDKTGTLTQGTPDLIEVRTLHEGLSEDELLRLTAAAESQSEHPLGKVITAAYEARTGRKPAVPDAFRVYPGQGIVAEIEDAVWVIGQETFLESRLVDCKPVRDLGTVPAGATVVYATREGELAGCLVLKDQLRPGAKVFVDGLFKLGILPVVMTGDDGGHARAMVEPLGIRSVYGRVTPRRKPEQIRELREQGRHVMMIGDGINDLPAVKEADVGVALGGTGSDITIMAADMIIPNDDLELLAEFMAGSF